MDFCAKKLKSFFRSQLFVCSFFILFGSSFLFFDIADDMAHGSSLSHIFLEVTAVLLTVLAACTLISKYFNLRSNYAKMQGDNLLLKQEFQELKTKSEQLAKDIQDRMDVAMSQWHLTEAEKDVALLLLKGFSNKEIASLRETSENTVRQQTTSIYKKSNLHTRSELSAYFIEDLLGPKS